MGSRVRVVTVITDDARHMTPSASSFGMLRLHQLTRSATSTTIHRVTCLVTAGWTVMDSLPSAFSSKFSRYTLLCCIIVDYNILYYTLLCYTILYCAILLYTLLYVRLVYSICELLPAHVVYKSVSCSERMQILLQLVGILSVDCCSARVAPSTPSRVT